MRGVAKHGCDAGLALYEQKPIPVSHARRGQYRDMARYAFSKSWGQEDERLAAVERQLDPVSQAAADQLGLAAGWRCWEVGAGRGSMALWLAARVIPSGSVLATDIDIGALAGPDHGNVSVARHDLERDDLPPGADST
jgi:hypothetical protein